MTLKEFFRKARRGRKWGLRYTPLGRLQVRCEDGLCPMAAVAPKKFATLGGVIYDDDAEEQLGFSKATVRKIATAADDPQSRNRQWLLKNLGINNFARPA